LVVLSGVAVLTNVMSRLSKHPRVSILGWLAHATTLFASHNAMCLTFCQLQLTTMGVVALHSVRMLQHTPGD
jgi:hypothetical protein